MQILQKDSFAQLSEITQNFEEFKKKNSLDEYFKKYLSPETRKNTLKLVDELLQVEENDYLKEYKE